MKDLEKKIQKEIEKKIDKIVFNKIFPEFKKIAKHFIIKDYYNMYEPIYYKRNFSLINEWKIKKNNGIYEIFINEKIEGVFNKKKYYIVQIVEEGKIRRIEDGGITYRPYPFISKVVNELKKNETFMKLLQDNGLKID